MAYNDVDGKPYEEMPPYHNAETLAIAKEREAELNKPVEAEPEPEVPPAA